MQAIRTIELAKPPAGQAKQQTAQVQQPIAQAQLPPPPTKAPTSSTNQGTYLTSQEKTLRRSFDFELFAILPLPQTERLQTHANQPSLESLRVLYKPCERSVDTQDQSTAKGKCFLT